MIPTDHGAESVHDRPTEGTTVTDEKMAMMVR